MPAARAYLVTNPRKERALAEFHDLSGWLEQRGRLAGADANLDPDLGKLSAARPQRIIALGGDGTILSVGRATAHLQIPIIGVNLGKLGYLASYSTEDVRRHLDAALGEEALISKRMALTIDVDSSTGQRFSGLAINDCVLHTGPPYRMLGLEVRVDGFHLATIAADGLIIATPTGSTAHNMAAGGPIVEPEVEAILMTSICPHSFAHRPVVMKAGTELKIAILTAHEGSTAMIDGQVSAPTPAGTIITVRRCVESFRLVRHPRRSSWAALVQKLKWGDGPGTPPPVFSSSGVIHGSGWIAGSGAPEGAGT